MNYRINRKRYTMRDALAMAEGDMHAQVRIMAACMVDEQTGEPVPAEEANNYLLDLSVEDNDAEVLKFQDAIAEAQKQAVPLASKHR